MYLRKIVLGAAAILVVATLLFAQQPQQQPNPPLRLKNHPEVGIESPENRPPDLRVGSAERFEGNAATTRAKERVAAAEALSEAACLESSSRTCISSQADLKNRQADLLGLEQQAADNEANFYATLARQFEEALERGPDNSQLETELRNLIEACGDDSYCREIRTRTYALLSQHVPEWAAVVADVRKALVTARQGEKHWRDVAHEQRAQRAVALRDAAEYQYLAGLKQLTAEVLVKTDKGNLPRGTVIYSSLVNSRSK
jgi:hypothetical protein